MANRWGNNGNSERLYYFGSKITADGECNHEIKTYLLLGIKAMTNLDNILKSRDISLSTKIHLVKAMVFPIVMYGCESWFIKKTECQRIDAFELWCWRRLLRIPWTAKVSNQSIWKEFSPEYSLEGLMLRLKFQYSGHLMWRTDSLGKNLDAGKDWRLEEKGMTEDKMVGWHYQLNGHEFEQAPQVGHGQGSLVCCSPWGHKDLDMTEWLNWTVGVLYEYWILIHINYMCWENLPLFSILLCLSFNIFQHSTVFSCLCDSLFSYKLNLHIYDLNY